MPGDKSKSVEPDGGKIKGLEIDSEDRLTVLREFQRKNGLCFKCAEKWSHNHNVHLSCPYMLVKSSWMHWRRWSWIKLILNPV